VKDARTAQRSFLLLAICAALLLSALVIGQIRRADNSDSIPGVAFLNAHSQMSPIDLASHNYQLLVGSLFLHSPDKWAGATFEDGVLVVRYTGQTKDEAIRKLQLIGVRSGVILLPADGPTT